MTRQRMAYNSELRHFTKEEARTVECPYCLAKPGENCLGVLRNNGQRRTRTANHIERIVEYQKLTEEVTSDNIDSSKALKSVKLKRRNKEDMAPRTLTKKTTAKKTVAPPKKTVGRPRKTAAPAPVEEVVEQKKARTPRGPNKPVKEPLEKTFPQDNPNLLDPETDKNKKIQGLTYAKVSELLGIGIGTEQFLVAIELMKGGNTRNEINERLKALLPATTINGTPKQVTNLVSGVHNRMEAAGFVLKGTYQLMKPPTSK